MEANTLFEDAREFAAHLRTLHEARRNRKLQAHSQVDKRQSLTHQERHAILMKTARRCHICGGEIGVDESWDADHVFAHAQGGAHAVDNYLPAHSICNNYRWFYGAEEFQWILKLGVWSRTQIEKENGLGLQLGQKFVQHEARRDSRRKR